MFSPPPLDWIQECQQAWAEKQKEKEQALARGESDAKANASTERVCFYNEQEARPAQARKKHTPAEGVSFF